MKRGVKRRSRLVINKDVIDHETKEWEPKLLLFVGEARVQAKGDHRVGCVASKEVN